MNKAIAFLLCCLISLTAVAQEPLEYFLPTDVKYDQKIPTPESVLGYPVGKWHVSHDQLVLYMRTVAAKSDRMAIQEFGKSHEDRQLLAVIVTSKENHGKLKSLRDQHVQLTDPTQSGNLNVEEMPVVVWQGYSIHGDEPSGSNAALLYAYYLAAAQGPEIEAQLNNSIILLDPCFNPDGLNRFANWVNTNKSKNPSPDSNTREHDQDWPSGRTNHYWFDLNRDWLPTVHPESKGRIALFHEWKPNVLTDHHEMGTNSSYFFQPGVPARTNPNTPQLNQDLTGKIADFHAKRLDKIGSAYYTRESFDDYYYGKGSTYPDVNGCVGILFEQASSRGHVQNSIHGELTFEFTIRNQFLTSLSTLDAATSLKSELLNFQKDFYTQMSQEAASDGTQAYIFGDNYDSYRANHLVQMLRRHQIKVYHLNDNMTVNGVEYQQGQSFLVPLNQPQYKLIKAVFETRTEFADSLFYDVSAFTLPMAYNLNYSKLDGRAFSNEVLGKMADGNGAHGEMFGNAKNPVAYLIPWDEYYAPRALNTLLQKGLVVKVANKPFSATTDKGVTNFDRGTLYVPIQKQPLSKISLHSTLNKITQSDHVDVYAVETHMTPEGVDLGSPSFSKIALPKVLLITGDGVRAYDAGEVWHLLDYRYDMDVTMVNTTKLGYVDLSNYNVIVMVNGSYGSISKGASNKIKTWVREGGTLLAQGGAVRWAKSQKLAQVEFKKMSSAPDSSNSEPRAYADMSNDRGARVIGGAIFETEGDHSHPLLYGMHNEFMPVFKRGTMTFKRPRNVYASPLRYTEDPLLAGYVWDMHIPAIEESPAIIVSGIGGGKVICFADNANFRGFWLGTNRLFMNAIFFGRTISGSAVERVVAKKTTK